MSTSYGANLAAPPPRSSYIPWLGQQGPAQWSVSFGHWSMISPTGTLGRYPKLPQTFIDCWWNVRGIFQGYVGEILQLRDERWIFGYFFGKHQEDASGDVNRKTGVGKHYQYSHSVFPGHFCSMYSLGWINWHEALKASFAPWKNGGPQKMEAGSYEPTHHPFSGANWFFLFQGRYIGYPWNKSLNGLFSLLNNVIPKSLKFGHWPSICFWFGSVRKRPPFHRISLVSAPRCTLGSISGCPGAEYSKSTSKMVPSSLGCTDAQIDASIAAFFPTTRGPVGI